MYVSEAGKEAAEESAAKAATSHPMVHHGGGLAE